MNVLLELEKARKMVENKTLRLEDFEALLIGLFHSRKPERVDYSGGRNLKQERISMTCKCGHNLEKHNRIFGCAHKEVNEEQEIYCECSLSPFDVVQADYAALVEAARKLVEAEKRSNYASYADRHHTINIYLNELEDTLPAATEAQGETE